MKKDLPKKDNGGRNDLIATLFADSQICIENLSKTGSSERPTFDDLTP
jgi:hypothetical protein